MSAQIIHIALVVSVIFNVITLQMLRRGYAEHEKDLQTILKMLINTDYYKHNNVIDINHRK